MESNCQLNRQQRPPDVNVPLDTFLYLDLTLDEDVPAGNYTAIFWHYIGAGDWVDYQSVPVDVHS